MKSIKLSDKKQKIVFGVIGALLLISIINPGGAEITTQSFMNDILNDLGLDITISTATTYMILVLFSLLLIFYFFKPNKR